MKIFIHFEGNPDYTFRAKDLDKTPDLTINALIEVDLFDKLNKFQLFVESYNRQKGQNMNPNSMHLLSNKKPLSGSALVSKVLQDGADVYIVPNSFKKCTRNGCGKEYDEENNQDGACCFHHGVPIFHEGRKGYSCCNKRVDSFDEFLEISGCTLGKHSDEKKQVPVAALGKKPDNIPNSSNIKLVNADSEKEVYSQSNPAPSFKPATVPEVIKEEVIEEEDPIDAIISPGTTCKHGGCNAVYKDKSSREENCLYHPGIPIFHEGSKKWSCCKPRVLEFDEFLKIEGCKTGKHKFLQPKSKDTGNQLQCRIDFYQNANNITVNIYGKNVVKESSKITFETSKMIIALHFKDGKKFDKEITTAAAIIPSQSKYEVLSTKVEVILKKAETGQQWTTLSKFGDL